MDAEKLDSDPHQVVHLEEPRKFVMNGKVHYLSVCSCVHLDMLQVPLRVDGVKVEPDISKGEGDRVKREHVENILAEETDGASVCVCVYRTVENALHRSVCK